MKKVTLCGSARFETEFKTCMKLLTSAGLVVIGLGAYPADSGGEKQWYTDAQKEILDLVHLEKVSMADVVLILDTPIPDEPQPELPSYVGFSTARELMWASLLGTPVAYLSDLLAGRSSIESAMAEFANIIQGPEYLEIPVIEREVAELVLTRALGAKHVADAQTDTARDLMHATLSHIAANRRPEAALDAPDRAEAVLNNLGLVILDEAQRRAIIAPFSADTERESALG